MLAGAQSASASNCWFESGLPESPTSDDLIAGLSGLILVIVAIYAAGAVISGFQFFSMAWVGQRALKFIRVDLFKHLLRLPLGFYAKEETGNLMSRITNDVDTVQQIMSFGLVQVLRSFLQIGWVIVVMLQESLPYALLSLTVVPFMMVSTVWFSNRARVAYRQARKEIGEVNADLQESISGVREVQAFSRGRREHRRVPRFQCGQPRRQYPRRHVHERAWSRAGGAQLRRERGCGGRGAVTPSSSAAATCSARRSRWGW
ncbi:MAG: ABC transporter transmembrane domain-containing protein [Anaerolineae bacterium]|nr:ABC transporter transmembrane domain-containing protein [Anaerolineae bacterium]